MIAAVRLRAWASIRRSGSCIATGRGVQGLALDLMEELRPALADRLALALLNRRQIGARDFARQDNGAVLLTDDGRKAVLALGRSESAPSGVIRSSTRQHRLDWSLICRRNCFRATCGATLTPIRRGSGSEGASCWCSSPTT
jgi:hypothetical protein